MDIDIKEVLNHKALKTFIRFPHTLYRGNACWVPPLFLDEYNTLRSDKNPAFTHCQARFWLAFGDGRPVGRVAAIINQAYIQKWEQRHMRFGWLDFVDDPRVSAALLDTVETWATKAGMTAVHGPLGFTDLDREGMLVQGFDELGTLATIYNHPYYPQHLERLGYLKDADWVEYEITVPPEPNPAISRLSEVVLQRNRLKVLEVRSKKELLAYAPDLFALINSEYEHLYGVVPLTEKQVQAYVRQYFGFVTPDFVPMVLDEEGKMVAFAITLPSLSRALQRAHGELFPFGFIHLLQALRKNERADLYLVAVKTEYQGKGLNAILIDRITQAFNQRGIIVAESNPELEKNHIVQAQWKHFKTRQHKRRRCFIKTLDPQQGLGRISN